MFVVAYDTVGMQLIAFPETFLHEKLAGWMCGAMLSVL